VNRPNQKAFFADQVKFDNHLNDSTRVNYLDDGPGASYDYDLAIKEFDNVLKSNVNFRNPDSVKMLICSSGLEELRGILHYQLMHK
jgi:ribonuclease I